MRLISAHMQHVLLHHTRARRSCIRQRIFFFVSTTRRRRNDCARISARWRTPLMSTVTRCHGERYIFSFNLRAIVPREERANGSPVNVQECVSRAYHAIVVEGDHGDPAVATFGRVAGTSWIARHRRADEFCAETGKRIALTYDNFRENAHRREGYAARDVPQPRRVPQFRYDPLNVVYHRVGSHHRARLRGRIATRWLSGRSASGLPARNRPLFRNARQPSSWRVRAMFCDASHVAARATSRSGAAHRYTCGQLLLSHCTLRTLRTFSLFPILLSLWLTLPLSFFLPVTCESIMNLLF